MAYTATKRYVAGVSDPGPSWLRHELPHPIAAVWHRATLGAEPDGLLAVLAVETALRLVTGLQLATRVALGEPLPKLLSDGRFRRPSAGSWGLLAGELRGAARGAPTPLAEALAWPRREDMGVLSELVALRNDFAHNPSDVAFRLRLEHEMATRAARLLEGLEPLRRAGLTYLLDAAAEGGDVFEGRAQRFYGLNPVPEHERIRWCGVAKIRHLYFEVGGYLLDPAPFISRGFLVGSRSESILLWRGFGARGDVSVGDDEAKVEAWQALDGSDRGRIIPFQRLARARGEDELTRHAGGAGDLERVAARRPSSSSALARAQSERTQSEPLRRPRSRRWPLFFAGGVLAGAAAAFALTWRGEVAPAPSGASGEPTRGSGESAAPASAPVASPVASPGSAPPASLLPTPQQPGSMALDAPSLPPARVCAGAPALVGTWAFDTVILGGRVGAEHGVGVRGHYLLQLSEGDPCSLVGPLVKRAYTMKGKEYGPLLSDVVTARASSTGGSLSFLARLRKAPEATITADIAMRLTRRGDYLLGLWRHEGADRERAGYWGALVGRRDTPPSELTGEACFSACVADCHGDVDPLVDDAEACLLRCVPAVDDCRR